MDKSAQQQQTPLERAIALLGSQSALAEAAGYTQQSISKALKAEKGVSTEMAVAIEGATGKRITRAELRPDIFEPAKGATKKAGAVGTTPPRPRLRHQEAKDW